VKSLVQAIVLAAVFAAPMSSFAQSHSSITRAEVRAELMQLENAGYNPGRGSDPHYPNDLQAAEVRVGEQNSKTSGFGGSSETGTYSEVPHTAKYTAGRDLVLIFFGH